MAEQITLVEVERDGVVYRLVVEPVDRRAFSDGGAEQVAVAATVVATPKD